MKLEIFECGCGVPVRRGENRESVALRHESECGDFRARREMLRREQSRAIYRKRGETTE